MLELAGINGSHIMKYQVSSTNTTPPLNESCMEEITPVHWNPSCVAFLIIPFNKLFQLCTCYGLLGRYFQTRCINERNHYYEIGQLETVEHILKEYHLQLAERDLSRKIFLEIDLEIILYAKKDLGVVAKSLDSSLQPLCW